MAQTEANVTALELERVQPKIRTLFDRDDKFYSSIKKRDVEVVSYRQMRIPLEIASGGAFQYFNPDGGDLGRGGGPQFDKAVVQPVFMSENIEYTKLNEWSTNNDRKAIVKGIRRLTSTSFDELRRQLDSQLMQPGTGQIATLTTVTTAAGVDTYVCSTDGFGTRLVRVGQVVQVYDATLATLRGKATVQSNFTPTKTITVSPAVSGATATDVLVVDGLSSPASLPALFGVPYHHSNASTGTWLGFSRSATPAIRANGINASSAALTLPLPRLAINAIGDRVGIDNNFSPEAWMHPAQQNAYEEIGQLISSIRKAPKEEGLDLYFNDNMQMAGAPVRTSFNWDRTRIDFVIKEVWGRGEILPLGFYKTDGRNIFELRGASGGVATADIFYLVLGTQTFVNNPAACAYIYGLAVPSGY